MPPYMDILHFTLKINTNAQTFLIPKEKVHLLEKIDRNFRRIAGIFQKQFTN